MPSRLRRRWRLNRTPGPCARQGERIVAPVRGALAPRRQLVGQVLALLATLPASAQAGVDAHGELAARLANGDYSRRGADTCLRCHDAEEDATAAKFGCPPFPLPRPVAGGPRADCATRAFSTVAVFDTVHGNPALIGSPFARSASAPAGLQCEACHGPVGEHGQRTLAADAVRPPMINFGARGNARADLQNQLCLACHADYGRASWTGGVHEQADVACADCHRVHSARDPVRERHSQAGMCLDCHQDVAAELLMRSAHPIREQQLACSDCHDPHGANEALARRALGNEACTECHAELRGPFLWEHPPAAEDCGTCHLPHGSNQPSLLARRPPQLCQACHSSVGHRSMAQVAGRRPAEPGAEFLFAQACLNCHAQVHGSNHPSGNLLRR